MICSHSWNGSRIYLFVDPVAELLERLPSKGALRGDQRKSLWTGRATL
jgi:hypothetical protein